MLSLDDLKKQYSDAETKTNFSNNLGGWYPFWKMDFDQTATVRFLPDGDPNAAHFLIEKWMHKLEVVIDGKSEQRNIACLQMYNKKCPICEAARKFYDEGDEDNGQRFYKKKSWIGQVIVIESPFDYDDPEQQPKLISINRKIYDSIKAAIMQGDLDTMPTDMAAGYNFRINKTRQGKWADYSTSRFSPKATAVEDSMSTGLELNVLKDKLPKEPSLGDVEGMLVSALTGDPFIQTGTPAPSNNSAFGASDQSTTAPAPTAPAPTISVYPEPAAEIPTAMAADESGDDEADTILAAIAARKAAS